MSAKEAEIADLRTKIKKQSKKEFIKTTKTLQILMVFEQVCGDDLKIKQNDEECMLNSIV